jgi:MarR family transcriptional regulator for hemolysin
MGVLLVLSESPGCTLGEMAAKIASDDPTASRVLSKLSGKGLVKASTDELDRRCARIVLTAKGRALVEELRQLARATEKELVSGVSAEQLEVVNGVLAQIARNVERASAPAHPPAKVARRRR